MMKLVFIGDRKTHGHVIVERLWELISIVVAKKFRFKIVSVASADEAIATFKKLGKDPSVLGFAIAEPWKGILADKVDRFENPSDVPVVNMAYRDSDGQLIGVNTQPCAVQKALEASCNLYKRKTVLVVSAEGAGIPLAYYAKFNLDKVVYLYDPSIAIDANEVPKGIVRLPTLYKLAEHKYDIIINTTPLGRYYFDKRVEAFTSPLDLATLGAIAREDTIVQEINYLPATTLLLQMAHHLRLPVITGDLVLVFEALECFKYYFGITLDQNTIHMLVEEIKLYIAELEASILDQ